MKKLITKELNNYTCDCTDVKLYLTPNAFYHKSEQLLGAEININVGQNNFYDNAEDSHQLHLSAKVLAEVFQFLAIKYPSSTIAKIYNDYELNSYLENE